MTKKSFAVEKLLKSPAGEVRRKREEDFNPMKSQDLQEIKIFSKNS